MTILQRHLFSQRQFVDITSTDKKRRLNGQKNYWPLITLPLQLQFLNFLKIQLNPSCLIYGKLNKVLCGFWKEQGTQYAIFKHWQFWKYERDRSTFVAIIWLIHPRFFIPYLGALKELTMWSKAKDKTWLDYY